jgi:hypothetical protein
MATRITLQHAQSYVRRTVRKQFSRGRWYSGVVTEVNEALLDESEREPPFFHVE